LEDHRAAIAMKFAKKWSPSDKTEPGYRMRSVSSHFCVHERAELIESTRGLNYSSWWPWLFAVVLSMALWAMFGWLLWWR
jgi:hypothetical protein